ncbi:MAG TPA: hypothetical protein VIV11_42020 [Kofleriaceae bacterium]
MRDRTKPRDEITLLDVLIDGFEKNEVLHGYHMRVLPLPNEQRAVVTFGAFVDEATRWYGPPARTLEANGRRLAAWRELEIRQAGQGILVRIWSAWFCDWWHDDATWNGDPLKAIYEWIGEETDASPL